MASMIRISEASLEEKTKFVASRMNIFDNTDVTVDLDVCRACIPFSLHWLYRWCADLVKFGRHVLLFWEPVDRFIIHQDLQTFLVDANGSSDLCRLNLELHCDGADELFQGSLHEVYGTEVVVFRLSTCDSWLHKEARDCINRQHEQVNE